MAQENPNVQKATFAGGCFWCTESDFKKHPGVWKVISGYTGGHKENPNYQEVSSGRSGHWEAVEVYYNPDEISYEKLLHIFWRHVDPTDDSGQFVDRGAQYRTAIFYHDEHQKEHAEQSKKQLNASGRFDKPIVTEILPVKIFYPAEAYHQNYDVQNPLHYKFYRKNSGRDKYINNVWATKKAPPQTKPDPQSTYARPDSAILRKRLTPLQYKVTQHDATEPPFKNDYWDHKKEGIYVDVTSGEPLFSSRDKYNSGTGWPSFTRPLELGNIVKKSDRTLLSTRTEVRSKRGDAHLGHLFNDGPPPTGQRYCINSASLRFIPKEALDIEGYARFKVLFEDN